MFDNNRIIITKSYEDFVTMNEKMNQSSQEKYLVSKVLEKQERVVDAIKEQVTIIYNMIKHHSEMYEKGQELFKAAKEAEAHERNIKWSEANLHNENRKYFKSKIDEQLAILATSKKDGGLALNKGFAKHVRFQLWRRVIEDDKSYMVRDYLINQQAYNKALWTLLYDPSRYGITKVYPIFNVDEQYYETQSSIKLKLNYYGVDVYQQIIKHLLVQPGLKTIFMTDEARILYKHKLKGFAETKELVAKLTKDYDNVDGRTREGRAIKAKLLSAQKKLDRFENLSDFSNKNDIWNDIMWDMILEVVGDSFHSSDILTDQEKIDEYMDAMSKYTNLEMGQQELLTHKGNIAYKNGKSKSVVRVADWEVYEFLKNNDALELREDADLVQDNLDELEDQIRKAKEAGNNKLMMELASRYLEVESTLSKETRKQREVGFNANLG